MAGTIVTDRIESDASYASSVNIASPLVIANTISVTDGTITGNLNIDANTIFVDAVSNRTFINCHPSQTGSLTTARLLVNSEIRILESANSLSQLYVGMSTPYGYIGSNASKPFQIETNGSARQIIDASGRVTKPFQPSFYADMGGNTTIRVNALTKISCPTVFFNVGSHYNSSTSRFTVPVSGTYCFFIIATCNTQAVFRPALFRNGGELAMFQNICPSPVSGYAITGFTIATLVANDYIEYFNNNTNNIDYYGSTGVPHTGFGGYLLG